jgi:hypothetical protein
VDVGSFVAVVGAAVVGMAAIIEVVAQPHTNNICITPTRLHRQTHSYTGGCAHALLPL